MSTLRTDVSDMLNQAWRDPGFCVPNPNTYPFQWLWDSCFHSIIWAELDDERGVIELTTALANQRPSGFVPHVSYWSDPTYHRYFWGQTQTSTIAQPPMYGHAVAELARRGFELPDPLLQQCHDGLLHLVTGRKRSRNGLISVFHPWETGCDDSARWDDWRDAGLGRWFDTKGEMIDALVVADGEAMSSELFDVGSVGFSALVAFNIAEFCSISQPPTELAALGTQLGEQVANTWSETHATWVDAPTGSGTVRTADALVALLVDQRPEGFAALEADYLASFGIRGAHPQEPSYEPDRYWRGACWPQLTYLLAVAAKRAGRLGLAEQIHQSLAAGAAASELSEYWNPDTGTGRGAIPQSWSGLALVAP